MKKYKNILISVFSNCVIVLMLVVLGVLAFDNSVKSVFVPSAEGVYYRGSENKKEISLMINVYWGNEYIEEMLASFDEYNVKTTFFVGGSWVSKFPELFLKIVEKGHEIGNHGYFHKDHSKLDLAQNQQEIMNTHKIVQEYTGKAMTLFAPPSGAFNDYTLSVAKSHAYKTIMWTKDTIDWRDKNTQTIYNRAIKNMSNGDLILMHPTLNTMEALPQILKFCIENGFSVVPVSQNIAN